jgi:hypothetical protein
MRRLVTTILLCLLVLSPAAIAAAQTPEASPTPEPPFPPWRVAESREFDVDGEPVALSPDGDWIAGIGPYGRSICAWDAATLEPTCAGEDLRIQASPIHGGLAWSPDSSAVAFITGDWRALEPTDVMVFDVERGWLRNLTHTALTGRLLVHTGPGWTADSSRVVFAQTDPANADDPGAIVYYDLAFSVAMPVPLEDAFYLYAPVVVMPDDTVVFRIDTDPVGAGNAGLWRVEPDGGNLRQVLGGDDAPIDRPVVIGVAPDGAWLLVASESAVARLAFGEAFYLVDSDSGDLHAIALEDGEVVSQPVFGEAARYLLVQDGAGSGGSLRVLEPGSGESQALEGIVLRAPWLARPATWAASGEVLIPRDGGGLLLRLETASAA